MPSSQARFQRGMVEVSSSKGGRHPVPGSKNYTGVVEMELLKLSPSPGTAVPGLNAVVKLGSLEKIALTAQFVLLILTMRWVTSGPQPFLASRGGQEMFAVVLAGM